jgi:excisionase family DNA binding protein
MLKGTTPAARVSVEPLVAAEMLGIGRTMVFELLRRGDLPSYTIGRRRLIPVAAIERFVEERVAAEAAAR